MRRTVPLGTPKAKPKLPARRTTLAIKTQDLLPKAGSRFERPPRYWRSYTTGMIRGGMIWNPPEHCPNVRMLFENDYWVDTGCCNLCKVSCICKTKELEGRNCKDPRTLEVADNIE